MAVAWKPPPGPAFFSTVTTFGTPLDVTLSEIAVEAFYPANAAMANAPLGDVGAG
ncbi:MAG TPA: hypothetical protein VG275_09045 [Solirubrobacteraceae bacterium]|nr:hypothetical protein [Solirubrobacteraceae bacterium]